MKKIFIKLTAAAAALLLAPSSGALAAAKVLTLPSSLKTIGAYAFYKDASVEKAVIPEGVKTIGAYAFAGSSLTEVNLPASLEDGSIDETAFDVGQFIRFDTVSGSYGEKWAEQYLNKRYPPLAVGDNSIAAGKTVTRSFAAQEEGIYAFYTSGGSDTAGTLYDSEMNLLTGAEDGGDGENFRILRMLSAGEKIYVGVEYSGSAGGTETLTVEKMDLSQLVTGSNSLTVEAGKTVMGSYTVPKTGIYTIYTDENSDAGAVLYDSELNLLLSNDDTGNNTYRLNAGDNIYISVCFDSSSESGTVSLVITNTIYRALLIGQVNFKPVCNRNWADVLRLEKLLETVNDGQYTVSPAKDLTKSAVKNIIGKTFADADEDDVSLIFYASHGVTSGSSTGALLTYNGDLIQTGEFAAWLKAVPGKVIVLIGTCGSGAIIGRGEDGTEEDFDPEAFDKSVIRAFAEADTDVMEKSGELAADSSKFCVMTSSMTGENSWGYESSKVSDSGNLFAYWLYDGAGGTETETVMPADSDESRSLTFGEWYTYVRSKAAATLVNGGIHQHPQVYPDNSGYVVFTK